MNDTRMLEVQAPVYEASDTATIDVSVLSWHQSAYEDMRAAAGRRGMEFTDKGLGSRALARRSWMLEVVREDGEWVLSRVLRESIS